MGRFSTFVYRMQKTTYLLYPSPHLTSGLFSKTINMLGLTWNWKRTTTKWDIRRRSAGHRMKPSGFGILCRFIPLFYTIAESIIWKNVLRGCIWQNFMRSYVRNQTLLVDAHNVARHLCILFQCLFLMPFLETNGTGCGGGGLFGRIGTQAVLVGVQLRLILWAHSGNQSSEKQLTDDSATSGLIVSTMSGY